MTKMNNFLVYRVRRLYLQFLFIRIRRIYLILVMFFFSISNAYFQIVHFNSILVASRFHKLNGTLILLHALKSNTGLIVTRLRFKIKV